MSFRVACPFFVFVALLASPPAFAGTLDDAPFRVIAPSNEWQVDDSNVRAMSQDVFLVATISHTNSGLKSVIIRAVLKKPAKSALDELAAGIRDSLARQGVKASEADSTFLGYKARIFKYQIPQGGSSSYNEATLFVADGRGWTIACVGPADKKDEVKKIIGFYRKKV